MNISFKDFIKISEGKQVGTLYHFTRLSSLQSFLTNGWDLGSHMDYFSFTRNPDMLNQKYKNDFTLDWKIGDKRVVRIVIDGDKLSNNFKIEPYLDVTHNIKREQGEYEEIINKSQKLKSIDIEKYIKQIDIKIEKEYFDKLLKQLPKTKIKINQVNPKNNFKKVK